MSDVVAGMIGKRLMYERLIADNGLDSGRGRRLKRKDVLLFLALPFSSGTLP